MQTQIFKIDPVHPQQDILQIAAQAIRTGRLVVFPTETVYGVGADAFNEVAVKKIFAAKERPTSDPLIVHISHMAQLAEIAGEIPALAWRLAKRFWPGPLTFILERNPNVPSLVSAGLETVAVRMPSHPVALALLRLAETAIAAPSANLFTRPSSTTIEHVLQDLAGRVDLILDAGRPDIGLESTVVDLTATPPAVLRPGGTPVEALQTVTPEIVVKARYLSHDGLAALSPGMLSKHYSPRARVILFEGQNNETVLARMRETTQQLVAEGHTVGIMTTEEESPAFLGTPARVVIVGARLDLSTVGQNLFAKMRELDAAKVDVILVKALNKAGLGLAIWDRLVRAAEGNVVRVD